jgi:hypothetical protein
MSLQRRFLLAFPLLAVAGACFTEPVYPGDQVLGTFRFTAKVDRQRTNCNLAGPDFAALGDAGTFTFDGTFSRFADGGGGWFTLQGFSRDAGYEGQMVRSTHRASARLPSCGTACEGTQIEETLSAVLLSHSQDELVGRNCAGLGDGGVPLDGGAQPPGPTPNGYDVARACGTLTDHIIPGTKNCECKTPCTAVYTVEGSRLSQ